MPPSFPLSRSALPTVAASSRERAAARRVMRCLLEQTVSQFDALMRTGEIDAPGWRQVSSPADQGMRMFRERNDGETSRALARELNAELTLGMTNLSERDAHRLRSSYLAALTAPALVATSSAAGKVENAMFAVLAPTQEDTALISSFMLDDVADSAILRSLGDDDSDRSSDESTFLGYKFIVRSTGMAASAAAGARKYHDLCYLEFSGYTQSPLTGERLGFHLVHSVDLPDFPDLSAFNSSRSPPFSARCLYRQKSDKVVEVFVSGNVIDLTAPMTPVWSIKQLLACAEAKRLTHMIRRRRDSVEMLQTNRRSNECYLCRRSKRFFGGALLSTCDVCRQLVCSKCRNDKKIFILDVDGGGRSPGLGQFERVTTCKTCVLVASAGYAPPPMHMLISEQMRTERERSATRGRSGSSSGSRSSSTGGRGSHSERSSISNTSRSMSGASDVEPRFQPSSSSVLGRKPAASTVLYDYQNNSLSSSATTMSASLNSQRGSSDHLGSSSSRGGTANRTPVQQRRPVDVAKGYAVPLQAPMSIAKTRAMQQQSTTSQPTQSQRHMSIAKARAVQQQSAFSQQTASQRAHQPPVVERGGTSILKPAIRHHPPPANPPQTPVHVQGSRRGHVRFGNCQPPRRDSALVPYDIHGLRRAASSSSSVSSSSSSFSNEPSKPSRPSVPSFGSNPQQDSLYARMLELSKAVESTYKTTQQNGAYLSQQPQHAQWQRL